MKPFKFPPQPDWSLISPRGQSGHIEGAVSYQIDINVTFKITIEFSVSRQLTALQFY